MYSIATTVSPQMPFWSDSCSVSLIEGYLLKCTEYSWLSHLVCPSLDCVHSTAIFGVVYCKMVLTHILSLFHPWWCILILLIYNDGWGLVQFWVLPWCRCWGCHVARKFHPRRFGCLGWIVMFDLQYSLWCILVGGFLWGVFVLKYLTISWWIVFFYPQWIQMGLLVLGCRYPILHLV